jgi:asparagine synthase (glutamine-hydrolysing)
MCGIAGIYQFNGERPTRECLDPMMTEIVHRGPDSEGAMALGRVALGFRRLALVDLIGGDQPHFNPDRSVVSVCNGEIYNYRELARDLSARGHRFRSRSDTEVIVHLYEEYGADLAHHLDGQFAFAVYDARIQQLLLCRDQCGVIPLFHTIADGRLLFASEIKSLLRHPGVQRRVDLRGLDQLLALPGLVSPQTMFEGISSLRPGGRIVAGPSGVSEDVYWDLDYPRMTDEDSPGDFAEHAAQLRDRLARAVETRLAADVPVGFYLSGGLDSSLLGGLMTAARPSARWPSYSISFPERSYDESRHQQIVARQLETRHHEVVVNDRIVASELRTMVWHAECPVKESYNVCSYLLSRRARETGVRCVLSGEGADELFGGYPGYRFDPNMAPASSRSPLDVQLEREASERMWGLDLRYEQDQQLAAETRRYLYSEDVAAEADSFSVTRQRLVDPDRLVDRHPMHQRSYLDFRLRLADHLLGDHGDRMSLANGVEMRFPYLAKDVIDYMVGVPASLMVHDGQEKAMLRRAAEGLVPAEVLQRTKFGFRGQTSTDLLKNTDWFADLVSPATTRRLGYFNPEALVTLARRQRDGTYQVHPHLDTDYLMVAATFALFVEEFGMPCLG